MNASEMLKDAFGRVRDIVHRAAADASPELLAFRPDAEANSIGWLLWHLTRVQDDHVAAVAGLTQVWSEDGWAGRFGLPFPESATGYGQRPDEVGAVRIPSAELLTGYHDAVHAQTIDYLSGLTDADLDRVVDERYDPPVTLAVRLVSVVSDDLQHAGQASYIRGLAERR